MMSSSSNRYQSINENNSIRSSRSNLHILTQNLPNQQPHPYSTFQNINNPEPTYADLDLPIDSNPYLLIVYNCIQVLTSTSIVIALLVQTIIIAFCNDHLITCNGIITLLFRLFSLMFSIMCLFCEMEWTELIRTSTILQLWITRGLFYIYIGLMVMKEHENISTITFLYPWFGDVVILCSALMGLFGCLYLLMVRLLLPLPSYQSYIFIIFYSLGFILF